MNSPKTTVTTVTTVTNLENVVYFPKKGCLFLSLDLIHMNYPQRLNLHLLTIIIQLS